MPEPTPGDDDPRTSLATVRELLARSVTLPSERLRETLDDTVRRGRMTRPDADELVERLVATGRAQSEELLARLERLGAVPGRAASEAVGRARRAAGLGADGEGATDGGGGAVPIAGYDALTAAQVTARLGDLSPGELRVVGDHERRNANRKTVLGSVDRLLREAS